MWDITALAGMLFGSLVLLWSRKQKSEIRIIAATEALILLGVCSSIASWQSFLAGVFSAGVIAALTSILLLSSGLGALKEEVGAVIHTFWKHRYEFRHRRHLKAIEMYQGMSEKERQVILTKAEQYQADHGQMPQLTKYELAIWYLKTQSQEESA